MLKEALESVVWQFAYRGSVGGRRTLGTGGLSALEEAFEALGWEDPRFVEEGFGGCSIEGCEEWATGVGKYPPEQAKQGLEKKGFGFLCSKHWREHAA